MKTNTLAMLLATAVALCGAIPATAPAQTDTTADGLYIETRDDAGVVTLAKFIPIDEFLGNVTLDDPQRRSLIEKRRDGCHATATLPSSVTDESNGRLLNSYSGDTININGNTRAFLKYNSALSFICAYSGGWKYKSAIAATWDWVKRVKCGENRLGYGQVDGGTGDWTAGYTFDGDKFCW